MIITLSTSALLKALISLRPIVKKMKYLPILSCTLLEASADGCTFTCTNLQYALRVPAAEADVTGSGNAAIPFAILFELVKDFQAKSVTLTIEGSRMKITCGTSMFSIALLDAEAFPNIDQTPPPPAVVKKKRVVKKKIIQDGELIAYTKTLVYGKELKKDDYSVERGWTDGKWREIIRKELTPVFEMRSDNLTPMIGSIEASWHDLAHDPVCAYEVVGQTRKQYLTPADANQWKRSNVKTWQDVEQFTL